MKWFIENRPDLTGNVASMEPARQGRAAAALDLRRTRPAARGFCKHMLDEAEFLSPYGIRALSQFHAKHPYTLRVRRAGTPRGISSRRNRRLGLVRRQLQLARADLVSHEFPPDRIAAEASTIIWANDFKVECPTGIGQMMTLWEVAAEISRRLTQHLSSGTTTAAAGGSAEPENFPIGSQLARPGAVLRILPRRQSGAGLGASHQTGWTGLVTKLMQQSGESLEKKKAEPARASASAK